MYVLLVHNTEPASPSNPSLLCTTLPTGTSTWTSSLDGSGGTSTSTPRPGSSLRNLLMVPRREVLLSLSLNLSTSCLLMLLEMLIPVCQDSVRSVYKLESYPLFKKKKNGMSDSQRYREKLCMISLNETLIIDCFQLLVVSRKQWLTEFSFRNNWENCPNYTFSRKSTISSKLFKD